MVNGRAQKKPMRFFASAIESYRWGWGGGTYRWGLAPVIGLLPLIDPFVLFGEFLKLLKLLKPIRGHTSSIDDLSLVLAPVHESSFFIYIFRWVAPVLVDKSNHLIILGLPLLVLGHNSTFYQ